MDPTVSDPSLPAYLTDPMQMGSVASLMPQAPLIPEADALYDSLMEKIEPDLMRKSLPTLEEKYTNETSEERIARQKRYEKAFQEYYRQLDLTMQHLHEQARVYEQDTLFVIETMERTRENQSLSDIDSAIQNA